MGMGLGLGVRGKGVIRRRYDWGFVYSAIVSVWNIVDMEIFFFFLFN